MWRPVVIFKQNIYFLLLYSPTAAPLKSTTSVGLPFGLTDAKMNIREPQSTQNLLFQNGIREPFTSFTFKAHANWTLSSGLSPFSCPEMENPEEFFFQIMPFLADYFT